MAIFEFAIYNAEVRQKVADGEHHRRFADDSTRGYTSDWAIRWSGSGDAESHETKVRPTVPLQAEAAKVLAVRQGVHLGASRRAYLSEVQGEPRMEEVIMTGHTDSP